MDGRTRGRLTGVIATLLCAAFTIGIARASVGPPEQRGTFALVGGVSQIISEFWAEHHAGLTASWNIRQFRPNDSAPIRDYEVRMQKLMHLIVIRDDFATFAHLHPGFDASTGTFSQVFTKEAHHRYYVYADTAPDGIGQQVFRFTIDSDGPTADWRAAWSASPTRSVGPYTVTLTRSAIAKNQAQRIGVTVTKRGRLAGDLHPYLGAAAHAVLINTSTLNYTHVHPMARGAGKAMTAGMAMDGDDSAESGPAMRMDLPPLPAGTYKLWLEFKGENDAVYTAPFTLRAE